MVYGYVARETLIDLGEEARLDQLVFVAAEQRLDEQHVRRVAEEVAAWLDSRGHAVRRVDVPPPGKHPHADIMGLLLLVQASFGLFALLLSGVLVVNLLTASMASQVRQVGVMKAIGASRAQVAGIYLGQALLLGSPRSPRRYRSRSRARALSPRRWRSSSTSTSRARPCRGGSCSRCS
jgi:putative ABC transport system permease protein